MIDLGRDLEESTQMFNRWGQEVVESFLREGAGAQLIGTSRAAGTGAGWLLVSWGHAEGQGKKGGADLIERQCEGERKMEGF